MCVRVRESLYQCACGNQFEFYTFGARTVRSLFTHSVQGTSIELNIGLTVELDLLRNI